MHDDATGMTQPTVGFTGPFLEHSAHTGEYVYQECGTITAYPGGSIELSVFNAVSSGSKNTITVWDTTPDGGFTLRYANPLVLRMMKRTAQEAFGKDLADVFMPDTRKLMQERFTECAQRRCEVEFIYSHFGGRMLVMRLCPQVANERTVRIISTSSDITDYIRGQSRLKTENARLRQQVALLNTRLSFESLVSGALSDFMDAGSAGFDCCLSGLNRDLGMLLNVDQAYILQHYSETLCIHKARWAREDSDSYMSIGHIQSRDRGFAQLTKLLVINDTLREQHLPFSRELLALGVHALLAVPIRRENQIFGLVCLVQTHGPRAWTTAEISLTRGTAASIMSAYLHIRTESNLAENVRVLTEYDEALQDILSQKETLADISCGFLRAGAQGFDAYADKALQEVSHLLCLDRACAIFREEADIRTYEWLESGLPRSIVSRNGALREAALQAVRRAPAAINDTSEDCSALARAAAAEGLRSVVLAPIPCLNGSRGALLGCKAIGSRFWEHSETAAMDAIARVFADAYHHAREYRSSAKTE